jgi:hypothetical protein
MSKSQGWESLKSTIMAKQRQSQGWESSESTIMAEQRQSQGWESLKGPLCLSFTFFNYEHCFQQIGGVLYMYIFLCCHTCSVLLPQE